MFLLRFFQSSAPSCGLQVQSAQRECNGDANANRLKLQNSPPAPDGALRQLADSDRSQGCGTTQNKAHSAFKWPGHGTWQESLVLTQQAEFPTISGKAFWREFIMATNTQNIDTHGASTDIEERLRLIIDKIPTLVWSKLPDGSLDFFNQRFREYTGLSLEDGLGWGWINAFHPDDRAMEEWRAALAAGRPFEREARLRGTDGKYRWFALRATPVRNDQGVIIKWYGTSTDIDDRKQAETELRQLVDAVPQHIVVLDRDGARLHANQVVLDYHGITLEEFLVVDPSHCFHPQDLETYEHQRQSGIDRGAPWEAEMRLRRKDGQYRWFLMRAKPLRDDQDRVIRWYLSRTDIEDRKQAEHEVQQIVDAVPQHIVVYTADGQRRYPNKVTLDFFGWSTQDFLDDDKIKGILHPDDLPTFFDRKQRGISSAGPFNMEVRILRKDGQYRWFLFLYKPHRNEQGDIVRWYATGTDIEERKQAERELQQETDRLNLLLELTNKLVSKLELRDLLRAVAESVHRIIQCDLVAVFLQDAEAEKLRSFVSVFPKTVGLVQLELGDRAARRPIPIDGTLVGKVFHTGLEWSGSVSDLLQLGL